MKKNLSLLGLVLVLLVFNKSGLAQLKTEAESKQTTSVKLEANSSELKSVFENKSFVEALKVLVASGEKLDIKTAKKTTFVNKTNEKAEKSMNKQYEITFDVLTEDGKSFGEYKRMVYAFEGNNTFIYFDEPNSETIDLASMTLTGKWIEELPLSVKQKDKLKAEKAAASFCFKWNGWQTTSIECDYNYFCAFTNQRARYLNEKRTCKTNSNHVQTRRVKIKCERC